MIKKNSLFLGIFLGLICPLVVVVLYYLNNFPNYRFVLFLKTFMEKNLLSPVLSLAIVANLAVFFLFIKLDADNTSKGILISTFVYGAIILFLKLAAA